MIAALHPCSFVDFPGRLAAVLFTQGCDLRCRYCHNPSLCDRGRPPAIGLATVESFLLRRRGFLDGVVVTGGEPTLCGDLERLLRTIRGVGLAVKLDTNGMHPDHVGTLLAKGLVDYLAVDVKAAPGKDSDWVCGHPRQAERALATLAEAVARGVPHEARTTVVDRIHDRVSLGWIGARLARAGVKRWYLQKVHSAPCLDGEFTGGPPENALIQSVLRSARSLGVLVDERGATAPPG